jgi:hypothetical protein
MSDVTQKKRKVSSNPWDLTSKYWSLCSKNGDVYHPNMFRLTLEMDHGTWKNKDFTGK